MASFGPNPTSWFTCKAPIGGRLGVRLGVILSKLYAYVSLLSIASVRAVDPYPSAQARALGRVLAVAQADR